jgi:hypothetical protein
MKEFETIVGCTKALLQQRLGPSASPLKVTRIDEGGLDGDLCATVTAAEQEAVAVVWPTAEKLKQIKALAKVGGRGGGDARAVRARVAATMCRQAVRQQGSSTVGAHWQLQLVAM